MTTTDISVLCRPTALPLSMLPAISEGKLSLLEKFAVDSPRTVELLPGGYEHSVFILRNYTN